MIAATIEPMAFITPKLEIVSIDPNYVEYDWDDYNTSSSTSSDLRSHENNSEDPFELINSSSKDVSTTCDTIFEAIPEDDLIFSKDSKDFNRICFPIDAYRNVVDWLESTPAPEPLFPNLIKINAQNEFTFGVLPNLNHKEFEIKNESIKIESRAEDSGTSIVLKKNHSHEKSNAENLIGDQPIKGSCPDKPPTTKSSHVNNILFEKNLIENTKRMKTSPVQEKKRLNLQEYFKRRPGLKLNLSKKLENNKELNDTANDTNQSKSEQGHTLNSTIHDMYEEIIVVSIGSNTDVSIDPKNIILSDELESISEITDTIDSKRISSQSLISSIRDVIIKKSNILSNSNNVPESIHSEKVGIELDHGEDKTIMHLKKDRLRVKCSSIGIQTDSNIRFPTLESLDKSKINVDSKSFSRSRSTSSRSSHNSYASERRKRKPSNSPSSRYTVSRNNYSRNGSKQGFEKSHKRSRQEADERCTVYVGRIETTTSKNDLMKKFLRYGEIRDVTTHQKENGLKFGFVTFKSAKDAYNTIDASANDTAINMYDISFGGRRAFCKETYFDLDNTDLYQQVYALPTNPEHVSFEDLLRKVKLEIECSQKHNK